MERPVGLSRTPRPCAPFSHWERNLREGHSQFPSPDPGKDTRSLGPCHSVMLPPHAGSRKAVTHPEGFTPSAGNKRVKAKVSGWGGQVTELRDAEMPTTAPPAGRRAGTGRPARPRVDATLQASLNSCAFPSQAIKPGRGPRTRAGGRPPIHGADMWCARAGHGAGMGAGAGGEHLVFSPVRSPAPGSALGELTPT